MRSGSIGWAAWPALSVLVLAVAAPSEPAARKARPVAVTTTDKASGATIDWSRGLILARAGAAADLRAPTAGIARVKAERTARERASAAVIAAAKTLPAAPGLRVDDDSAAFKALGASLVLQSVRYTSDGSAIAEVGLPIESVRRVALGTGEKAPTAMGPSAVVINASTLVVTPVIGLTVVAGATEFAGPTLYFRGRVPPALLGSTPVRFGAQKTAAGRLELVEKDATALGKARDSGAPVFVLIK